MNLTLPPRVLRRVVLAPAVIAATALLLAVTPFVVLALAFSVRFLPGRWRVLRLVWFVIVYLVRESISLFALGVLWVLSGFGWRLSSERFVLAHVTLIGWYLRGLVRTAKRVLGLELTTEGVPELDADAEGVPTPVLVFSRHAGAGDSVILVHLLVNLYHRRPHIVLKEMLQLAPCIDVVLNRLPNRFIGPHGSSDVVGSIRSLATELERDGALILFPEGGNFTEGRRRRAIDRLVEAGLDDAVARAEELTYVLPPRPGGALAAIDAAPDANVLFVAHTGLEQLSSLADLWRGLPMDRDVKLTWWTVRRDEVPEEHDERVVWLYEWWEVIDTWIEEHHAADRPAAPVVAPTDVAEGSDDR